MIDRPSADNGGQKRRSFTDATELFARIVPLPGDSAESIAADAPVDHVPAPTALPPIIPLPQPFRSGAKAMVAPAEPVLAPGPSAVVPAPSVPAPSSSVSGQAAAMPAGRAPVVRRNAWRGMALLALVVTGSTVAIWQGARQPPPALPEPGGLGVERAAKEPARSAPAPAPPVAAVESVAPRTDPNLEPARHGTSEPASTDASEQRVPDAGASTTAPTPVVTPAPLVTPAPETAIVPPVAATPAPQSDAAALSVAPPTGAAPASLPTAVAIAPVPAAPAATLGVPDRSIIIYSRGASTTAGVEASRVSAMLAPLATQIEMRMADTVYRRPTIVYYYAEDADAAHELAAAIPRVNGEWRFRDKLAQKVPPPLHSFQVWLPDR